MKLNEEKINEQYGEYLIVNRRLFHQEPELSLKEYKTSEKIRKELDKYGIKWRVCGHETGTLAVIEGKKPGRTILLRGDIDALPITEIPDTSFKSMHDGVMHACGHDCHISMLLTAARIINDRKDELCGKVVLAFQYAEELAKGARGMVADQALSDVDGAFAIHVWSDVESKKIACSSGPMMASTNVFKIKVKGKGGHGSAPNECVDALQIGCRIAGNLQHITSEEVSPFVPTVVTVGHIESGTVFNAIADNAFLEGSLRCYDNKVRAKIIERIKTIALSTAQAFGATAEFEDVSGMQTPVVINDSDMVKIINNAAKKDFGEDSLAPEIRVMGSEDFAYFMEKVPGALAFLGVRNEDCNAVWPQHNPNYTVDENALIRGAILYAQTAFDHNEQA